MRTMTMSTKYLCKPSNPHSNSDRIETLMKLYLFSICYCIYCNLTQGNVIKVKVILHMGK